MSKRTIAALIAIGLALILTACDPGHRVINYDPPPFGSGRVVVHP